MGQKTITGIALAAVPNERSMDIPDRLWGISRTCIARRESTVGAELPSKLHGCPKGKRGCTNPLVVGLHDGNRINQNREGPLLTSSTQANGNGAGPRGDPAAIVREAIIERGSRS
jgi:hypothetical protein